MLFALNCVNAFLNCMFDLLLRKFEPEMPEKCRGEHGLLSIFKVLSLRRIIFSLRSPAPIWQWTGSLKLHTESYRKITIKASTDFCSKKMMPI